MNHKRQTMDSRFKVSDLIYETHVDVPKEVIRKIEQYHLPVLNELQTPINSVVGYRSYQYEIMKGRPGTSAYLHHEGCCGLGGG